MHAHQTLHYTVRSYMKFNKVTCSLSQFLEHQLLCPLVQYISLTVEKCYPAFTHFCTSAIVLKWEWMVVIISINNIFPYCSNKVQFNKYSQKLASYSYTQLNHKELTYNNNIKIINLKGEVGINHCYKKQRNKVDNMHFPALANLSS